MSRPQRPSADKTRARILKAAKALFLVEGYHGASVGAIAKKAQVNQNLIFHHFQNKETLWMRVKEMVLTSSATPPEYDMSSAKAYFKSVLDYRFKLYRNNPDLATLVKWQQVSGEEAALIGNDFASPNQWLKPIRAFQKRGEIISDISAKLIMLFIIFSTHAPFMQSVVPFSKADEARYKDLILSACLSQFCV